MPLTVTVDTANRAERISKNYGMLTGKIAFDSSYPTGGEAVTDISKYFSTLLAVAFESEGGYNFAFDKTNNTVVAYLPSGTPAIGAGTSHTHGAGSLVDAASASTTPGASAAPSATVALGNLLYNIREDPDAWELLDTNVVDWTTLDLSGVVPAGAVAVVVRMSGSNNTAGQEFMLRKDATVASIAQTKVYAPATNIYSEHDAIVECTTARSIQYRNSDGGNWNNIRLTVKGWYTQITLPTGTHTHTGAAHTHAVALDGGVSGTEAAHTHAATAEVGDEVGSGGDLSGITALQFTAFGLL